MTSGREFLICKMLKYYKMPSKIYTANYILIQSILDEPVVLSTQSIRIQCLESEVPKFLHIRQLCFTLMSGRYIRPIIVGKRSLGASSASMLHDGGCNRPPNFLIFICVFFRDHIHVPQMFVFIQLDEVRDTCSWKYQSLRAASKTWHLMHAIRYWEHSCTSSREK